MAKRPASSAAELTDDEILERARARRRAPDTISDGDQALLIDYFSVLGCAFERSVSGAVLEFQQLGSATSRRCRRCRGDGVLRDGGFGIAGGAPKKAPEDKKRGRPIFDPTEITDIEEVELKSGLGWCPKCRGLGRIDVPDEGQRARCDDCYLAPALRPPRPDHPVLDDAGVPIPPQLGPYETQPAQLKARASRGRFRRSQCRTCCGTGEPPTMDVKKRELGSGGSAPDGGNLSRFAKVSRRLGRMRARERVVADATAALFGDLGTRWAPKRGRVFALCHLTAPGKQLARQAERWVRDEKARRKKPLTRKEAETRLRWRNPAAVLCDAPFDDQARHQLLEQRERARRERRLSEQLDARVRFVGPIERRPLKPKAAYFSREIVCRLPLDHPAMRLQPHEVPRKRDALAELDAQLEPEKSVQDRIGWVADLLAPPPAWKALLEQAKAEARALERRVGIAWNRAGDLPRDEITALVNLVDRAEREGLDAAADYIRRHAGER
jgi:hypothetical protein